MEFLFLLVVATIMIIIIVACSDNKKENIEYLIQNKEKEVRGFGLQGMGRLNTVYFFVLEEKDTKRIVVKEVNKADWFSHEVGDTLIFTKRL